MRISGPDEMVLIKTTAGNPVSKINPAIRCMFSLYEIETVREYKVAWTNDSGVTMGHCVLGISFVSGRTLQANMTYEQFENICVGLTQEGR